MTGTTMLKSMMDRILSEGIETVLQSLTDAEAIAITEQFGTHNYHPLPVNITGGEGARVHDGNGKEYIDCIGAYSAVAHGHLNPHLIEVAKRQLDRITLTSRAMYNTELALFLQALAEFCEQDMVCPMNTGAEANETAIKLARKWAYTVKDVPANQAEILVCEGNFHGRTTTIVGFSSEEQYHEHFGPFGPGFKIVPFGDLDAMEAAITPNTCAIFAEPIQAEGGVIIPPTGWMSGLRELCDAHNILLIWDEVQTGFARTGHKFGWMAEAARPDIMTVGKPLGGGLLPVAAAVGQRHVMEVFKPGDHGSTFGGNSLAAVVGVAALAEFVNEDYAGMSAKKGAWLKSQFESMGHDCIVEVRGRGLLIGLEFAEGFNTKALAKKFIELGVLTKETRQHTFRFSPPIVITEAELTSAVERVDAAIRAVG
ncbi:MAG: ornithine--oxo-acid transaminase [Chthonomonas sp.]|nr:ornithine--oxo-acid transaminase [Chthonomonas sp.]